MDQILSFEKLLRKDNPHYVYHSFAKELRDFKNGISIRTGSYFGFFQFQGVNPQTQISFVSGMVNDVNGSVNSLLFLQPRYGK